MQSQNPRTQTPHESRRASPRPPARAAAPQVQGTRENPGPAKGECQAMRAVIWTSLLLLHPQHDAPLCDCRARLERSKSDPNPRFGIVPPPTRRLLLFATTQQQQCNLLEGREVRRIGGFAPSIFNLPSLRLYKPKKTEEVRQRSLGSSFNRDNRSSPAALSRSHHESS